MVHSRASQLPAPSILSDSLSRLSGSRSDEDRADRLRYMTAAAVATRSRRWLNLIFFFLRNSNKKLEFIFGEPKKKRKERICVCLLQFYVILYWVIFLDRTSVIGGVHLTWDLSSFLLNCLFLLKGI